ncbi:FadD3 family acyl-CoA ligase [Candidatus Binatia bacterium]|jgi:acyl-CoA synthetase (AMP-forming)/AMP-acid ligase II|nr:FadD3 family acyl-CoA ligase [Candidatus Binatia bacterium]
MDVPATLPALVARAAERFAGDEALVGDGIRLTFAGLHDAVLDATRALVACDVAPGERIALWAPNATRWVIAALAVHASGAVLVPLNTRFRGDEAAWILARSRARILLTVRDFLGGDHVALLRSSATPLPDLAAITTLDDAPSGDGCTSWRDLLARGEPVSALEARTRAAAVRGDDPCDVLFTSGTTGRPKGALLAHAATVRAFDAWAQVVGLRRGDRYLVVNPFFHAFGLKAGIVAALSVGATIVPHAVFDVAEVARRVAEERISVLPGPPALYQSLLDDPRCDRAALRTLRLAVTGAATVPVELVHRMRDELGFASVVTGYGLTEATGIVTMCRHDDPPDVIARTAGRAIPGVELRLVDDDGHDVPDGTPGEILVHGFNVMRGYLDDPEATAAAIDADGWLHTGDVGVRDAAGNLTITDRKKDLFIVGGFNAYPAEIERVLAEHPAIAEVAVVGMPDERLGEVGCAFVVPRAGHALVERELIAWSRARMANFKVPRRVVAVDALPRNASGKVLRVELRAAARRS